MGSYLADTNLLLRLADPNSEQHAVATQALARLLGQGNEVYLTPQEFHRVLGRGDSPRGRERLRMDQRTDRKRSC